MKALSPGRIGGLPLLGWRVREGALLLRTPDAEVGCVCDCGRSHLLPDERLDDHLLRVVCHGCGRAFELPMAPEPAP